MEAGSRRTLAVLGGLAALALFQPAACGPKKSKGSSPTVIAALQDLWPEVMSPALDAAATEAAALETATAAWAAAPEDVAARQAARDAWFATMDAWQRAELLQIGPAGSSLTAVGGADLRDAIYSWPTTNPCRVDQETVEENWSNPDFFEVELVNVVGLDALEVLLFSADDTNTCPPQVAINANGTWDAIGPAGIAALRADYAATLAARVADDIDAIRSAWDPADGDFAASFAGSDEGIGPYESAAAALNAILDGLFYLELATKDRKLAEPLGLRDCGATSCLSSVETTIAGGSNLWIQANLGGFRSLWLGGEGTGLDEVLRDAGEAALANAMLDALDAADAEAAALTVPIDVAATTDPSQALAVHAAIAAVTDLLKGDVATVLLLQVPDEAAGDND